jgi:hypothetical protein
MAASREPPAKKIRPFQEQFVRMKYEKHLEERLADSQAALDMHRATQTLPTAFAPAEDYLPLERMRECLLPDGHPDAPALGNGVACRHDGSLYVATSVAFVNVEPAAFAWWFAAGCPGDEEYRTWHPEDHISGHFIDSDYAPEEGNKEQTWCGREHVVVEALGAKFGGREQHLRIKFCSPAKYGIDHGHLQGANCHVALTARVCVLDAALGWLNVGHFMHFTVPLPNGKVGFELRSRFWLGDVELPAEVCTAVHKRNAFLHFALPF